MPRRTHPLSFDELAARAGVTARVSLGVMPIRVRRIVGSAGKAEKLGSDFLPIGQGPAAGHYRDILNKMKDGAVLPHITVYQLGSAYFVVDGHTRVAAAKALGIDFLDAEVIQALPRREGPAGRSFYARRDFETRTGLQGIRLTAPWRYDLLEAHIDGYRLYLERSLGREVPLAEAARTWHRSQYLPTLLAIRRRRLRSGHGGRTVADVYTDLLVAWKEEGYRGLSLREVLDRYTENSRERGRLRRAAQSVTDAVDRALPIGGSTRSADVGRLVAEDVDAELEVLQEELFGETAEDGTTPSE